MLCDSLEWWEVGGGSRAGVKYVYWWLIHVLFQKPAQRCKTIILQLKNLKIFQKGVANTFQNCLMIRVRC